MLNETTVSLAVELFRDAKKIGKKGEHHLIWHKDGIEQHSRYSLDDRTNIEYILERNSNTLDIFGVNVCLVNRQNGDTEYYPNLWIDDLEFEFRSLFLEN